MKRQNTEMNKKGTYSFIPILFLFTAWAFTSGSQKPLFSLLAVALHELGHIVGSFLSGTGFQRIEFQRGGLILIPKYGYRSYTAEAVTALSGPLFNLISAAICYFIASNSSARFFADVSLSLGLLNLLPVESFDGEKILSSLTGLFLPDEWRIALCGLLSFLSLFFLWSIAVYAMIKSGESLSLFVFSIILFSKMLKSRQLL